MFSTPLRRIVSAMPFVALAIALTAATTSFDSDSMRIVSPHSGKTVSGEVLIEGTITTSEATGVTVGLAEQRLGECGPVVAERSTTVASSTSFSFTVATQLLSDGVYCVVALADNGAISHVIGDVRLANGIDDFGDLQLPTLSAESPAEPGEEGIVDAGGPLDDISALAPAVLAATGVLGMLVLVFLSVGRRRLVE